MIKMIAATDLNMGIGYENELLMVIPEDMKRFKTLTTGSGNNTVLCGNNTFKSMGKLPNRQMVVATNDKTLTSKDVHYTTDIHNFISNWNTYATDDEDLWIVGGSQVYKETLQYIDELYLTVIAKRFDKVDAYFSIESGELSNFTIDYTSLHIDEHEGVQYNFITMVRNE